MNSTPTPNSANCSRCKASEAILTQAWSPIEGITFYPGFGDDRRSTLDEPVLQSIGDAHGKSAAQVMLRWHLQQGRSAIPNNPDRIAENFDIFDFELPAQELARINALDSGATTWQSSPETDERYASFIIQEA